MNNNINWDDIFNFGENKSKKIPYEERNINQNILNEIDFKNNSNIRQEELLKERITTEFDREFEARQRDEQQNKRLKYKIIIAAAEYLEKYVDESLAYKTALYVYSEAEKKSDNIYDIVYYISKYIALIEHYYNKNTTNIKYLTPTEIENLKFGDKIVVVLDKIEVYNAVVINDNIVRYEDGKEDTLHTIAEAVYNNRALVVVI